MNRRAILAGTGATLLSLSAGCQGLTNLFRGAKGKRTLSLTDVGVVDEHPIRLDVNLRSRGMGTEATPELQITLEARTNDPLFIRYSKFWPADALLPSRTSDPPALRLLADREFSDLTVDMGKCPTSEYRPTNIEESIGHRIRPDTQYSVQYFVVGSAQQLAGACPPPGTYRFQSQYTYASASEVEQDGWERADKEQFEWGFSLSVEDATK